MVKTFALSLEQILWYDPSLVPFKYIHETLECHCQVHSFGARKTTAIFFFSIVLTITSWSELERTQKVTFAIFLYHSMTFPCFDDFLIKYDAEKSNESAICNNTYSNSVYLDIFAWPGA